MKIFSQYVCNNLNAGPKAKVDVERILQNEFKCEVKTLKIDKKIFSSKLSNRLFFIKKILFVRKNVKKGDRIIVQSPFSNQKIITNMLKNQTVLIHDIDGIRENDDEKIEKEVAFYKECKYVIAHNKKMKEFLVEHGVASDKIIELELFDYLCENEKEFESKSFDKENVRVVYAGNLKKSPFIQQIESEEIKFKFNLYGIGIEKDINDKMIYKGAFQPDELPNKLEGDLGLVWDGNFDESDENEGFKKYTKYNNPHKLSCYMAAGLPVVAWEKAAIADFIIKNNVGYVIKNIYEINNIDFSDYEEKRKNAIEIGKKVRSGHFTKEAIRKILSEL